MGVNEDTSAARIVAVLESLAQPHDSGPNGLSVSEVARALGRDKSSVSRQLKSLTQVGLVEKTSDGLHVLGWRVCTLAARAGDQRLLLSAPAVMRYIGRRCGERVHLSVRKHDEVLTILTEGPVHAIGVADWVGRTVPILGTSSGRVLMIDDNDAEITAIVQRARHPSGSRRAKSATETIARVRNADTNGYAVVVDEQEDGLSAVAAPIRDPSGRIVAALNVSAPTYRIADQLDTTSGLIHRAALHLSRAISAPVQPASGSEASHQYRHLASSRMTKACVS